MTRTLTAAAFFGLLLLGGLASAVTYATVP